MSTLIAGKHSPPRCAAPTLRALAALLMVGLLALAGAQAASAHAELLSTTPENGAVIDRPPAEAVLTFNEPVQLIDGSIRLFPGNDAPLTLEAQVSNTRIIAALPAELADGVYALSYRVASADGHPISGAITFTIGEERQNGSTTPVIDITTPADTKFALSALTALQYLCLMTFAGLILFERLVLRSTKQPNRNNTSITRLAGIGACGASLLLIPASALNVTGAPLTSVINPAAWWSGVFWAPATAAVIVCVGVTGSIALLTRQFDNAWIKMLVVLLSMLALTAPVLVGHTQLMEPRAAMVIADLGHLLAGSFWTGGVLGLLLLLAESSVNRSQDDGTAVSFVTDVVLRFSRVALWSVVALAVSGTIMGAMIVGSVDALITTGYGLTLLLKIGMVIPIVTIAAYNRIRLLPRISSRPNARKQWQTLSRTLSYEAALLIAALLLTGFLTNLSPTHEQHDTSTKNASATAQRVSIESEAQGLKVRGEIKPVLTGNNEITFTLEYEGKPVIPKGVTIRTRHTEHDLGPFQTITELDPATGRYSASLDLPVKGEWEIRVLARVSTFSQPIVPISVTVN